MIMNNISKKSILLFYRSYLEHNFYNFDKTQIKNMFEKLDIKDYENQKKLNFIQRVNYKKHFNEYVNLFNLFFLLYHLKYYTEKLDKSIFYQDFEKAKIAFDNVSKFFLLTTSIFTDLELLIRDNFKLDIKFFSFDYKRFFDNLKDSIFVYEKKTESEKFKFLIRSDIRLLEDRINTYKFFLPYFTIIISPYFKKKDKDSAINVLKVLKIILNKSTLQYIQIQKKEVNFSKELIHRGNRDGTTRILGIFTRYNDDVYLFRCKRQFSCIFQK